MRYMILLAMLPFVSFMAFGQKKGDIIGFAPVLNAVMVNNEKVTGSNLDSLNLTYADKTADFKWLYSIKDDELSITIKNNASQSFRVLWQESAYISAEGSIERVFFGGLKYFGRYSEQLPTRIFRYSSITNKLPVYSFVDEELRKVGILPIKDVSVWSKLEDYQREASNRHFRVVLLIEGAKGIQEYDFHFRAKVAYK